MVFDPNLSKHCAWRDFLIELGIDDPERDSFYSTGSTITKMSIRAASNAFRKYKNKVKKLAQDIIDENE